MAKKLDPIVSEFETQEQADSYDKWFRAKVEKALQEPGASYSHDEVMARMTAIIEEAAARERAAPGDPDTPLDPIVSEFATRAEAESHDRWVRAKVTAVLNNPGRQIPHEAVMARMDDVIAAAAARRKAAGK